MKVCSGSYQTVVLLRDCLFVCQLYILFEIFYLLTSSHMTTCDSCLRILYSKPLLSLRFVLDESHCQDPQHKNINLFKLLYMNMNIMGAPRNSHQSSTWETPLKFSLSCGGPCGEVNYQNFGQTHFVFSPIFTCEMAHP